MAARKLQRDHEVTSSRRADWIGGHTHTVDVPTDEGDLAVDTGFIVFNEKTYPELLSAC